MQQPPAQTQIASICLKVVTVGLLEVVVIIVLEVDTGRRVCWRGGRQGDDGGEVVATAKEIELDAGQKGEQGDSV